MNDLTKNTLRAIQDDLEAQYTEIEANPDDYEHPEQLKQQLDEKMEVIRGYLEGRWSFDV